MVPTLPDAQAAARNTRAELEQARNRMRAQARSAGRNFRAALHASDTVARQGQRGIDPGPTAVRRTMLGQAAFHGLVAAEAEKFRTAYLALSYRARLNVLYNLQEAARARDARRKQMLMERAARNVEEATVLEHAAERTKNAVKGIPEPEAVSMRKANRIAVMTGVPTSREASISPYTVMNEKLMNPLMSGFYPDDMVRAASSLQGLGDITEPGFLDSLTSALGIGAGAAGGAAIAAGQEAARNNPAAGAAIAAGGGLLSALAASLGLDFNAGQKQASETVGESETPGWVWPVGIAAAGVGGYLLWRVLR